MPVSTPEEYNEMLTAARNGKYALPAVNVTNLAAINAALKGFSDADSDGIIQISIGGGKFASGLCVQDEAFGARALASLTRDLAQKYSVHIALHTDHCRPEAVPRFIDPLIELSAERVRRGLFPLFNSHMLDASELPLAENLKLSQKYLERCNKIGMLLELEIGIVGGEEDGAAGGHGERAAKLYTSPQDMLLVRETLGESCGHYLLAATFGNVHGSYKSGVVKLKPEILREGQFATEQKFGKSSRFDLVFHGGSGSELSDIRQTLEYGVVKMNVDTDTQYAFTKPIALHVCKNIEGVFKIDGEVGDKKTYDPRAYLAQAEKSMAARITQACRDLKSEGRAI